MFACNDRRANKVTAMLMKQSARSRVLVVDDTLENRELTGDILTSAGYEVQTASDGATALQMIKESPPDLILLDVVMPGMDGYEVCTRLKTDESTRDIPVIFLTGLIDVDAEAHGFGLGGADYVTKPISLPVVLARVKTHLALYSQRRGLEGMFRDVIEFAPDAFVLADMQGRIVRINHQAELLFGYNRRDLLGQPLETLAPELQRFTHEGYRNAYVSQPQRSRSAISANCLRKDGTEFPGEINLNPLKTVQGLLLMAVVRDVSERKKAEAELKESRQKLRELAAQTEAARENERKHIAREVHDELGQVLTALRMDLSLLGMQASTLPQTVTDKIQSMKGLVDRAIQGVRNVAANLRPSALDMGLVAAIEWLRDEFVRHAGIPCEIHVGQENIDLDETRSVVIFRIVQESLTNVARYARASKVAIALEQHGDTLWLEVRDDGQGFYPLLAEKRKSYGLLGMRERAIALGGQVEIISAPGQGTLISVKIPMQDNSATKDST
jgi:PAS domain S-box-containing protein